MEGNIIDIKRFTIHDGYGIRSTVFLKGCGLKCAWCHNPEGLENRIELWYLAGQCIRCGLCAPACPHGALSYAPGGDPPFIRIDRWLCQHCGACVERCPTTALSFDGQRLDSREVVEILLRDRPFYDQSGGGITLSGGDPLVQHRFAREILAACHGAGVHTAIETCLQGSREILEGFLPVTKLFIVDLKLADGKLHREYCGQENAIIRDNYRFLSGLGVDLLTRIPLIPGITSTIENVAGLARFVAACNPGGRVELINFNPLAENKYVLMNRSRDFFARMAPLDAAALSVLHGVLEAAELRVVRDPTHIGGTP